MKPITTLSLFDGISCGRVALQRANIPVENYFSSEVDKYAIKIADKNWPEDIPNRLGDVREINGYDLPKIDLLIGGSPCQSFSFSGKRRGMSTKDKIEILSLDQYLELKEKNFEFEGQSYLFWEYIRLLNETKPKYFLLENVKMAQKWKGVISEVLGVQPILINSSLLSAQSRNRFYWTNISDIKKSEDKNIFLKDVMLNSDDPTLERKEPTQKRLDYIQRKVDKGWLRKIYNDSNTKKSECLMATMYKQLQEFIWKDEIGLRFFTPIEMERLQTLDDNYTDCVSNTQRYKALGNGWTVDVIAHIFKNIKSTTPS